ncbi:hypothetical protein CAOG_002840 [Capsaspora owczarzaki ATCC 30864]|uniref:Ribosomal RNA large subunit methyltransferase K/L-like methyltransferase domain-containing protein n=1 Tax=Capsaspora owczarzaki (strain ATCC 30864) TaxID=595528 RepID=A0A0D2U9J0_CAPO3|nr:hypothetical protein CAOG_002840 [Capsaspora owczarzaki ATCC 30864]
MTLRHTQSSICRRRRTPSAWLSDARSCDPSTCTWDTATVTSSSEGRVLLETALAPARSFSCTVAACYRRLSLQDKEERRRRLDYIDFPGPIDMKNPEVALHLLELYDGTVLHSTDAPFYGVFFALWLRDGVRSLVTHYSLKTRTYINTTSMNETLAFLMAHQALIKPGSVVFDPFAGSCGMLVPCAHYGAFIVGGDIDPRMMSAKDPTHNARMSFVQYKLESQLLDVVVTDNSHSTFRGNVKFDAILSDPPYGIREAAKKIAQVPNAKPIPLEKRAAHIPRKIQYAQDLLICDLVDFAATHLVVGGRLVFWMPTHDEPLDEYVPIHPAMRLISNSSQPMAGRRHRIMVTLQKLHDPTPTERATISEKYAQIMFENSRSTQSKIKYQAELAEQAEQERIAATSPGDNA